MAKTSKGDEKEPLNPAEVAAASAQTKTERDAEALASYNWATNPIKLNRAKAWVNANAEFAGVKGKDLEKAVKDRYIAINGLLREEENGKVATGGKKDGKVATGGKKDGKVVNMAEDDGSED